jgi:glutamate-5-semialdehyde dehydrogenase
MDANQQDLSNANDKQLAASVIDRLTLNADRIEAMATGVEAIADMSDPLGKSLAKWEVPSGLEIERVSTALGVIGIIYESRPNVTVDAGALCLKSGNAAILRGGSDSFHSSLLLTELIQDCLEAEGLPRTAVQMIPTSDRQAVNELLQAAGKVDVIVPRGGKSLVSLVQEKARVPVFAHLEGICHIYVTQSADADMARDVTLNAKMRRTGICGACETLLIDRSVAHSLLPDIASALLEAGCELRGDEEARQIVPAMNKASEEDWHTEYLDAILSIKIVDGFEDAISHISNYSSGHTESIITQDSDLINRFLSEVDSAIVMANASTQFADGGEFGMGAEIGIATGKLHARGPVGAEQLTSFKYNVRGHGETRK